MKSYRNKKNIAIRAVALIIALLMVIGVLISAIISVNGVEDEVITDTFPYTLYGENEILIRLGVDYAEDTTSSQRLRCSKSNNGYYLYKTEGKNYQYIWKLDASTVFACLDGNLKHSYNDKEYKYYYRSPSPEIGGYHLLLEEKYEKPEDALVRLTTLKEKQDIFSLFPCYENGNYVIKAGNYSSLEQAQADVEVCSELLEIGCSAVGYTESGIKVLNDSGEIVFGFDCGEECGLGFYAAGEDNYAKLDSGYYRAGITEVKRYANKSEDVDGLSLIVICSLEEYVMGVVPWEIYNHWPAEIEKAFAITARSYAYANMDKHSKYGFDICSTSHCQNNKGMSRVNQNVIDAVLATANIILMCDGEIVTAYCNDLGGGSIAAGHQVWNQDELPYLQGMFTPWEVLEGRTYGKWSYSDTAKGLCEYLNTRGYPQLKDEIADVKITLCDNSSYVYKVTITDIHNESVTITRTRNVRNAFYKYLHSGNFVIEHNGEIENGYETEAIYGVYVMTADGIKVIKGETELSVKTAIGTLTTKSPEQLCVRTSATTVSSDVVAETKEFFKKAVSNTSENNGEFTFIGSGNGHGVGISQWGGRDLADLGKSYTEILSTYFPTSYTANINELK